MDEGSRYLMSNFLNVSTILTFFDEKGFSPQICADGFPSPRLRRFLSTQNTRTRAPGIWSWESQLHRLAPHGQLSGKGASQHHAILSVTTCVWACILPAAGQVIVGRTVKAPGLFMRPLKLSSCLLNLTLFLLKRFCLEGNLRCQKT